MGRVYYDEDATYLRSLEEERIELSGPTTEYYSLNRGTNVDTLYNEPDNDWMYGGTSPRGTDQKSEKSWNFSPNVLGGADPLEIPSSIQFEEMDGRTPMVRPEGFKADWDAILFITVNHWECYTAGTTVAGREPKEGDVVYVWNLWWDVIKAGSGGNVLDSPSFVGYRLDLKKRTEFTPDRKVDRT